MGFFCFRGGVQLVKQKLAIHEGPSCYMSKNKTCILFLKSKVNVGEGEMFLVVNNCVAAAEMNLFTVLLPVDPTDILFLGRSFCILAYNAHLNF